MIVKKYNLALLPIDKSEDFVFLSKKFSSAETKYQLGKNSHPHVTLCQFFMEENQIDFIWEKICNSLEKNALDLEFKSFSCITFDNSTFWISLLPTDVSILHEMQAEILSILNLSNKKPYDPHLTLISTSDASYKIKAEPFIKEYLTISDKFILSLGECDEIGQFISIAKKIDIDEVVYETNNSPLKNY